jgi:TetR/AcrR family transcriptional regulator, mexJK operon transcriptional repressor
VTTDQRTGRAAESPRYPAKRAAIARAALQLFVRDGYERTSVDAIAAIAGVSKRTVYSHYADKEQLFLSVIAETYDALMDQVVEISDREFGDQQPGTHGEPGPDEARRRLVAFIGTVAHTMARTPERSALIRLTITEAPHFPAMLDEWRGKRRLTPHLIRGLSGLIAEGSLDIADPVAAADHLSALTFGQINNRSLFGLLQLTDEQLDSIVTSGVDVFLRACRPG